VLKLLHTTTKTVENCTRTSKPEGSFSQFFSSVSNTPPVTMCLLSVVCPLVEVEYGKYPKSVFLYLCFCLIFRFTVVTGISIVRIADDIEMRMRMGVSVDYV
jgi:hypothetical protein